MTVAQYQQVYGINSTTPDNVERLAWIVCTLFDYDDDEVNLMSRRRFLRYVRRVGRRMDAKPNWFNRTRLETDATKITLGQFMELQYWLKDADEIVVMDYVAASLRPRGKKFDFAATVAWIGRRHFADVRKKVLAYVESQNTLIRAYDGLFGDDGPIDEPPEDRDKRLKEKTHPFIEQYGWQFSAKSIADHHSIKINDAYRMNIIEALNTLAYLKAKGLYDKFITK